MVGDEVLSDLFGATMRLAASWMTPAVLRSYLARADAGVAPSQYQTLRLVAALGPVRLRDLAEATSMTASNASKIVAELVGAGMVTRTVPASDRRVTLLEATPTGRRAVQHLDRVGQDMLRERLSDFTSAEVDTLARLLGRLADATAGWAHTLEDGAAGDRRDEGDAA